MTRERELYRVFDANLNRAREGLRVLEDVARFVFDDGVLAERVRAARHQLAQVANLLPGEELLTARDVTRDCGTTYAEQPHPDAGAVVAANVHRVQEALRVLEETARCLSPEAVAEFKQLRFWAYELEREFAGRAAIADKAALLRGPKLYVIVGSAHTASRPVPDVAAAAIRGGAGMIQLREKELPARAFFELAQVLRRLTGEAGVPLIINDRVDIAAAVGADGVHLGQEDLPLAAARRILGGRAIIGVSAHSVAEAVAAERDGADYVGVGPVFATPTKPELEPKGVALLNDVLNAVNLPVFAIGGITPENAAVLVTAGVNRVAVVSAVTGAPDVSGSAAVLRKMLEGSN
ncbi:MAG: thiamine phosphate synthase [Bacillota bacterium]